MSTPESNRDLPAAERDGALDAAAPMAGILADITAGVSVGHDLAALLRRFLPPIVDLAGAQAGAVRTLSEDGTRFELVGSLGVPTGACGPDGQSQRHCGHCGVAADARQLVWTDRLSGCAAHGAGGFFGHDCRAMLVVPLQHRGRLLGVYNLFFEQAAEPAAPIRAILKSVGELLGLALDNARLEQENLRATLNRERQGMAAEVHDAVAQSLAFAKMRMPLLEQAIADHDDANSLRWCADVRQAVSEAHIGLRQILTHLHSPADPQGLRHALEVAAASFRLRSGVELQFVDPVPDLDLAADQESQVFHIVQEALANVTKHAGAEHAWLTIRRASDAVEIVVEDDGSGLPAGAVTGGNHLGLAIMGERARRLHGRIEIGRRRDRGTAVRLRFPVSPAAAAGASA
ncbi:MAG: GAF domain-containing protein [Burkholderiaceae bacterium]|nr:GAF domain-containing protein [Burkholderiaceae bacterium]